jgi:hypothetical protein
MNRILENVVLSFLNMRGFLLAAAMTLAGCAATLVTCIPIKSAAVSRAPDGKVTQWTGLIMGKPVEDSPFELHKVGSDFTCKGETNNSGEGSATWRDGTTLAVKVPSLFEVSA